jgi:hypothetical protein
MLNKSQKIKKLWKQGVYKNRDQSYRTLDWKDQVRQTIKKLWKIGIYNTKQRSDKISKAHKGKYFGKRGRKNYIHKCIVCKNIFITKTQHRNVCNKTDCRKQYPKLRKINKITEKLRRKAIKKAMKGKIPKNLYILIKRNNKYRQYDMYKTIKKFFPTTKANYYVKTNTKRFLDAAIPELKIDFEYNGKVHLFKNVQINDKKRSRELKRLGWKIVIIDKNNFNKLESIIQSIKNGTVE